MMSERIRWGIMSTAKIARTAVIPAIQNSNRGEVVAIASRNESRAAEVAAELDISKAYGSYDALLADEEIDAVYIAVPNHMHMEWTIKAARAGKHVLCEKPAALNEEQVRQMIDICNQEQVVFAEALMYRYHPKHRRVQEIIESGEIGQVRAIHANFTYNNCYDTDNVRFKKEMGGGSLYDVGVYPISAARMYLGQEPEAVTVHALFSSEHDNVDMMASGLVEFPDKVALTFDCGMWACSRAELEILGTEGRIELPKVFGWENSDIPPQIIIHTDDVSREERISVSNSFVLQAEAFADAILDGTPLPFTTEDALLNIRVVEACITSAQNRERIALL